MEYLTEIGGTDGNVLRWHGWLWPSGPPGRKWPLMKERDAASGPQATSREDRNDTAGTITVILPAYCTPSRHGTSRLRLALASWAGQTLSPARHEVVLVDDGSDPPLADLVDRWGLSDRVRVLRQKNMGLAHAYNAGIDVARGEFVLFATDDELAAPELLAEHVACHQRSPGSLVFGKCRTVFHTELFTDVSAPELAPKALDRLAVSPSREWLRGAVGTLALDAKPITVADVEQHFDKVLAWAGTLPQFADIERALLTGRCHELLAGWLAVRVGNHSVATATVRALGGFDEVLDEHNGWYLDVELGIRLIAHGVQFVLAPEAVSVNLSHPREIGLFLGALSGMAYMFGKHRRMDVALAPLYFQRELGIAEYSRLLRSARKWWPDDM
jgi:glycosyltransferase involved in cell wall biosynthesis